jgi:RNA methyltransferase, TrmH family, group 1
VRIVLVEPTYEFNIGLVARAMKNFGFKELYIVNPASFGDEAIKYSSHASDIIKSARICKNIDEAIQDIDIVIGTTSNIGNERNLRRMGIPVYEIKNVTKGKIAVLFGNERTGLTNEQIDKCDILTFIPTSDEYPSMNLAMSVAVFLYEMRRNENIRTINYEIADKKDKEEILKFLRDLLVLCDLTGIKLEHSLIVYKRLLDRAYLSKREAKTLLGTFARIRNKLKNYIEVKAIANKWKKESLF